MTASLSTVTLLKASWLRISRLLLDVPEETLDLVLPDWTMAALRAAHPLGRSFCKS
jgi:hypothetical protein